MRRNRIYFFTLEFLVLSVIALIILAIVSEHIPYKKFIDPLGHLVTISPGIIALIFIAFSKKDDISLLSFQRSDYKIIFELIGIYLIVCTIEVLVQVKLGNIAVPDTIPQKQIFDTSVQPLTYILISCIYFFVYAGFGEEIAWRGFLFSKLKRLSYIEITMLTNVVWALWHLPMFLFDPTNGGLLLYRFGAFMLMCIEFGILLNYLRIRTNSVWGAIILHPMTNIFSYSLNSYFVITNNFWGKHPNLIVVLSLLPFAIIYYFKGKKHYQSFQNL